jgi:hypothetical protein
MNFNNKIEDILSQKQYTMNSITEIINNNMDEQLMSELNINTNASGDVVVGTNNVEAFLGAVDAIASKVPKEKKLKSIKKKIETDLSKTEEDNLQQPTTMNSEMNTQVKVKKPRAKKAVAFAEPEVVDEKINNVADVDATPSATEQVQEPELTRQNAMPDLFAELATQQANQDEEDAKEAEMPLEVWKVYKDMREQFPEAEQDELSEMAYAEVKTRKFKEAMAKKAEKKTALSRVPEQRAMLLANRDAKIAELQRQMDELRGERNTLAQLQDDELCETIASNPELQSELGIVAVKAVAKKAKSTAVASAKPEGNRATPTKVSRDFDKLRANDTLIHSIGDKVWEGRWIEGKVQLTKTTTDDKADAFLASCKCYKLAVGDRVKVGHQFASVNSWFQAHNALYNSSAYQKQTILAIKVRRADGSIVSIDDIVR